MQISQGFKKSTFIKFTLLSLLTAVLNPSSTANAGDTNATDVVTINGVCAACHAAAAAGDVATTTEATLEKHNISMDFFNQLIGKPSAQPSAQGSAMEFPKNSGQTGQSGWSTEAYALTNTVGTATHPIFNAQPLLEEALNSVVLTHPSPRQMSFRAMDKMVYGNEEERDHELKKWKKTPEGKLWKKEYKNL